MTEFRWTIQGILLAIALVGLTGTAVRGEGGELDKKRREPASVPSIEINSLRYEAVLFGTPFGYEQDGGILVVRDAKTGRLEWTQRIYAIDELDSIESDKQDVFISAMELSHSGKQLLITNERGTRFEMNLSDRTVKKLSGAEHTPTK